MVIYSRSSMLFAEVQYKTLADSTQEDKQQTYLKILSEVSLNAFLCLNRSKMSFPSLPYFPRPWHWWLPLNEWVLLFPLQAFALATSSLWDSLSHSHCLRSLLLVSSSTALLMNCFPYSSVSSISSFLSVVHIERTLQCTVHVSLY